MSVLDLKLTLPIWLQWETDTVRTWVGEYLHSRAALTSFLLAMQQKMEGSGEMIQYLDLRRIEQYIDPQDFRRRISEYMTPPLSEEQSRLIELAEAAFDRRANGTEDSSRLE